MKKPSNLWFKLPLLLVCGAVLLLWVRFDLHCPIRSLTGMICPGCGLARAWQAALKLELADAFRYHPMFWAVPLIVLFLLYDCRLFQKERTDRLLLGAVLLGFGICYAIRLAAFLSGGLMI